MTDEKDIASAAYIRWRATQIQNPHNNKDLMMKTRKDLESVLCVAAHYRRPGRLRPL